MLKNFATDQNNMTSVPISLQNKMRAFMHENKKESDRLNL